MKISIAYINDVHGYLEPHQEIFFEGREKKVALAGGYSRIYSLIQDIRRKNPNTLVFDGGDTFHGTLPLIDSKGEAIIPILNKIGFQAMVGHWDFAYGPSQLKKLESLLNHPVLGINVYNKDGSLFLDPYVILEIENIKVAVIGVCSNIIDKTMPKQFSEGLLVTDGIKELPGAIEGVRSMGADIVFLLSHNGYPQDIDMLGQIPGIDVCLSAHTHNRLYEATIINETILIQCGCHGSFVGHLNIEINDGKIQDFNYQLLAVDNTVPLDGGMDLLIDQVMKPYQELNEVVGRTTMLLDRYNTLESPMDELLLRSLQDASGSEIAFSNGWRYGAPIPVGPITKGDLYNMVPMNPVISTVDLTGGEIFKMLEENLERTFCIDPMKQMGGYVKRCWNIHVYMRIENPKGHRIQQIFIGDQPLEPEKVYKAAFITSQGVAGGLGSNRQDLTIKAVDAMIAYLKNISVFDSIKSSSFSLV